MQSRLLLICLSCRGFVLFIFVAWVRGLISPRSRTSSVTKDAKHEIGSPACGRQIVSRRSVWTA